MVRIKHTAHPINTRVSFKTESMSSDEALEVALPQGEALHEVTSSKSLEDSDDCKSRSGDYGDTESTSDDSEHVKVAAAVGITFDFGVSDVGKAHIMSMENNTRYILKGYYRAPDAESVSEPRANEAVVFVDFFIAGLRVLTHPVLIDILRNF
jgi:hypothetical protein